MGLLKNLGKTKEMVCTPGLVWLQQGTAANKKIAMGEGTRFGSGGEHREFGGVRGCNDIVITPSPHGYNTYDSPVTDPGGRR